jgi:peptidyl-tRNA hydrolase
MEALLYNNPEVVTEMFFSNEAFRNYLLSKIPPEELAKAEKIAREQNTTIDEILKKKFAEIIEKLKAE